MSVQLPDRLPKRQRRENRVRCPAHLNYVRSHRCCVPECFATPIEVAHVDIGRFSMGMKQGDDKTISLCAGHHQHGPDAVHRIGWAKFQEKFGIDALALAKKFADTSKALKAYFMRHPEMKPTGGD